MSLCPTKSMKRVDKYSNVFVETNLNSSNVDDFLERLSQVAMDLTYNLLDSDEMLVINGKLHSIVDGKPISFDKNRLD